MSDRGNLTLPAQWDILRTEPIEPQDVIKPEDNAETLSSRPNQTLVSTQTVTHEYLTLSGKVARETVKKNGSVTDVMDFVYDESGRPFALNHSTNGGSSFTTYYYVLNLQGDVVKLVTASGSAVATYEYDAWGKVLSATGSMADKNPLRYRGYYYDNETGFYYLQSRYYDSVNHRFINADSYASTGQGFVGTNMFSYCNNNPVIYADPTGTAADPRFNVSYINEGCGISPLKYALEDYVCNSGMFDPDDYYNARNIRISVRDTGRARIEKEDMLGFTVAEVSTAGAAFVAGKIGACVAAKVLGGIGVLFTIAGVAHFVYEYTKPVPEGDYDSFTVTVCWDSDVYDFGVSQERTLIGYAATYKFIWCDAFDDNQFWWVDEYDIQPIYAPLLP